MLSALNSLWARFQSDRRGVAAVEFAIVLPLLAMFYVGTVEVARFVQANSKTAQSAETVGNLLTRLKSVDSAGLDNIFAISSAIMNPFDVGGLEVVVTAVRVDANGRGTVHWARSRKGSPVPQPGTPVAVPADLQAMRSSYFLTTETKFAYQPLTGLLLGTQTIDRVSHFRPRRSLEINFK